MKSSWQANYIHLCKTRKWARRAKDKKEKRKTERASLSESHQMLKNIVLYKLHFSSFLMCVKRETDNKGRQILNTLLWSVQGYTEA